MGVCWFAHCAPHPWVWHKRTCLWTTASEGERFHCHGPRGPVLARTREGCRHRLLTTLLPARAALWVGARQPLAVRRWQRLYIQSPGIRSAHLSAPLWTVSWERPTPAQHLWCDRVRGQVSVVNLGVSRTSPHPPCENEDFSVLAS